jgi:thiamine-monophosphate kinase
MRHARPGDDIVLAGALGEAAAGLELLESRGAAARNNKLARAFTRPRPRLDISAALSGQAGVRGAIDLSDGLSTDLIHVCRASGVGCEVDGDALPVTRSLAGFCRARRADPVDWILSAGEDYALLLAVAPRYTERLARRVKAVTGRTLRVIGKFTGRKGAYHVTRGGKRTRFRPSGWDHLNAAR